MPSYKRRQRGKKLESPVSGWSPRYSGLWLIAHRLNELLDAKGSTVPAYEEEAWSQAERVVQTLAPRSEERKGRTILTSGLSQPSLSRAVAEFKRLAEREPVFLDVFPRPPARSKRNRLPPGTYSIDPLFGEKRLEIGVRVRSKGPFANAAWFLWQFYFRERGWQRLKRCSQCKRWFVDETRNHKKERCSDRCTWRWWNWARRQKKHGKGRKTATRSVSIPSPAAPP